MTRMKTSVRKSFGVTTLIVSLLVGITLHFSGTPLLSLESSHSESFPGGGGMIVQSYKMHWPLYPVCIFALLGVIALLWPARKPPILQS
jgi:hypothetical protein